MAGISLFWDTNMAVVTSRENTLYQQSYSPYSHSCLSHTTSRESKLKNHIKILLIISLFS